MIAIAWIVLIINVLVTLKAFFGVFIKNTISERVGNFVGSLIGILTCTVCIYILRL